MLSDSSRIGNIDGTIQLVNFHLSDSRTGLDRQEEVIRDSKKLIFLKNADLSNLRSQERNCGDVIAKSSTSGIYEIVIPSYSKTPFKVACDARTDRGGWTIILRRTDGSENFSRDWNTYKNGFGSLDGEFFLGLDKIHALTSDTSMELLVALEDFEGDIRYERYDRFGIANEDKQYALSTLGEASGTAGDSLRKHHQMKWSTMDRNNDLMVKIPCAAFYTAG
ncbi:fibrinogen C domain-containing protein 1-like [Drosophila innubila]|uniref:fibrinogen C domain-containing protein 1-like n=1 Tax=Drosophila innubila TaxID=198719 RepID=UPI00148D50B6|nr:fibrinogen C domain-containing protein 1-like [Drosophila innubila]